MTVAYRLRMAWKHVKEYAGPVIAADLVYAGIHQMNSVLTYPIADGVIWCVNFIIRTGFRDRLVLPIYGWFPWRYQTKIIVYGFIPIVLGILVGLWVNSRKKATLP